MEIYAVHVVLSRSQKLILLFLKNVSHTELWTELLNAEKIQLTGFHCRKTANAGTLTIQKIDQSTTLCFKNFIRNALKKKKEEDCKVERVSCLSFIDHLGGLYFCFVSRYTCAEKKWCRTSKFFGGGSDVKIFYFRENSVNKKGD